MPALKITSRTAEWSMQDSDDTNAKPYNTEDERETEVGEATPQQRSRGIPPYLPPVALLQSNVIQQECKRIDQGIRTIIKYAMFSPSHML